MAMIRLICGDGGEVVIPRPYFQKMSLSRDPEIARADSYRLECKASTGLVNLVLSRVYDESAHVTITKDNFNDLKNLCRELGFTGLDPELREFEAERQFQGPTRDDIIREVVSRNERIARHDKLLLEVQHQLTALSRRMDDRFRAENEFREAITRQVQALEARVETVARQCEERCASALQRMEAALSECVKRGDIDPLFANGQLPMTREQILTRFSAKESDFAPTDITVPDRHFHKWRDLRYNRDVAIRVWEVERKVFQKYFWREVSILAELRHEAVIRLIAIVPERGMIVVPWMENGTLEDVLKRERNGNAPAGWNATKKSIVLFGTAVAMAYIHSKNITHRGLRPANVLLNGNFEPVVSGIDVYDYDYDDVWEVLRARRSPLFLAPEVFAGEGETGGWTKGVDVYSYAVFLYRMFTDSVRFRSLDGRDRPTRSTQQLLLAVMQGRRLARVPEIPDFVWEDLICACWHPRPEDRPYFVDIVEHLRTNTEEWAFPGTDLDALREYQTRIMRGVQV